MAEPAYSLKVVTPTEVFFEGEVVSVTAPGEAGSFGVLAHHAAFMTTLSAGQLTYRDRAGKTQSLRIEGGFFEVSKDRAIVLTDKISGAIA